MARPKMGTVGPTAMVLAVAAALVLGGCRSGSDTATGTARINAIFDVGEHSLYLQCAGTGSPTVVFENGLGATYWSWATVPNQVGSRTCLYNRLGMLPSDEVTGARRHSGLDSVRDLHALLNAAGVPGPYLLVGADFGGLLAAMYAGTYPAEVVGLVLVDPVPPTVDEVFASLGPERAAAIESNEKNPENVDFMATAERSKVLVQAVPDIPVVLLAAARPDVPPNPEWAKAVLKADRKFVAAVPRGELRVVDASDVVNQAPDRVIAAVRELLEKTR